MVNLRIIQEKNNNQLSIEGIELTPTSMKKIKKKQIHIFPYAGKR